MIKKNQTYIHAHTDVKTTDGFHLRVFCIGFTERGVGQVKKTAYAKSKQVKRIRKKMIAIMQREIKKGEVKDLVNKLIPDTIADDIRKACTSVYPIKDVHIRKVKVLRGLNLSSASSCNSTLRLVGAPTQALLPL